MIFLDVFRRYQLASQFLVPWVDGVWSVSSSVGYQPLLFGRLLGLQESHRTGVSQKRRRIIFRARPGLDDHRKTMRDHCHAGGCKAAPYREICLPCSMNATVSCSFCKLDYKILWSTNSLAPPHVNIDEMLKRLSTSAENQVPPNDPFEQWPRHARFHTARRWARLLPGAKLRFGERRSIETRKATPAVPAGGSIA